MKSIHRFGQMKKELLEILNRIDHFVTLRNQKDIKAAINQIILNLERDKFEVIVVGEFSNGKSTFINALLKSDVLPSSSVPTTALLNKIVYADRESYMVHYSDGKKEKVGRQQFETYVSEEYGNLSKDFLGTAKKTAKETLTMKKVKPTYLEIGYPAEICKNNVAVIDSPGMDLLDEESIKIMNEYIRKSDATIFMLNVTQILTQNEQDFIQQIAEADMHRVFFILNFKDQVKNEADLKAIEAEMLEYLAQFNVNPKIYFISALHALYHCVPSKEQTVSSKEVAKMTIRERRRLQRVTYDRLSLYETGLPQLEEALFEFLSEDQGREKLRKPIERTKRLLNRVKHEHILFDIETLNRSIEDVDVHIQKNSSQIDRIEVEVKEDVQKLFRIIETELKRITIWYKHRLNLIFQFEKEELIRGLHVKKDFDAIRKEIDLVTAPLEKDLYLDFQQKLNQLTRNVLIDRDFQLRQELDILIEKLLSYTTIKMMKTNSFEDLIGTKRNYFGKMLGRIVTRIYTLSQTKNMTGRLKEKYAEELDNQVNQVEDLLEQLAMKMKRFYKQQLNLEYQKEKKSVQHLFQNPRNSVQQLEKEMAELQEDLKRCELYMLELDRILTAY